MFKKIICSLAFLVCSSAMADWFTEGIEVDKNTTAFIDIDTLRQNPVTGNVLMWIKQEYSKPQILHGKKYDKAVMLWNVECDTKRYKFDELVFYYKGQLVKMPIDETQLVYKNAIPNSNGWVYVDAICYAWKKINEK